MEADTVRAELVLATGIRGALAANDLGGRSTCLMAGKLAIDEVAIDIFEVDIECEVSVVAVLLREY